MSSSMENPMKKKCPKCKCMRDAGEFGRRPTKKELYYKTCEYCRKWNKHSNAKYDHKKYYEENKEMQNKKGKEWYEKNKEEISAQRRTDEHRKYDKEMRSKNWKKTKITKCRSFDKKRFEWKDEEYIDVVHLDELIEKYNNKCMYCENELNPHSLKFDSHFTIERIDNDKPHLKGNCGIACRRCNCRTGAIYKHMKHIEALKE